MKSFGFMREEISPDFYYQVWNELQKLRHYFIKFAKTRADEIMSAALDHILGHFNSSKGGLSAYTKKLAREMVKTPNKEIAVDFLENTVANSDGDDFGDTSSVTMKHRVDDISTEAINNIMLENEDYIDITKLSLEYTAYFIQMCDSLKRHDSSLLYLSDTYVSICLGLIKRFPNFNTLCIEHCEKYRNLFEVFIAEDDAQWFEADYGLIERYTSKRVVLRNFVTGSIVEDADTEGYIVDGMVSVKNSEKYLGRVYYADLWETMCDYVDAIESNIMKLVINNHYVVRTLGGSYSMLDVDLYNIYDLLRAEIVTNIVRSTRSKIMNIGSEYVYLLCNKDCVTEIEKQTIRGVEVDLKVERIESGTV